MIVESADVSPSASVHESASVWDQVQIREGAVIGPGVIVGRGAYIGSDVTVGENSKIQNYALVYEPAKLAEGVFIGPAAVLTNDKHPRAINANGTRKSAADWEPVGVTVGVGASIGARAVCIAPLNIGDWAMVAAGAVVVSDVQDFALVAGVPARQIGWVGKAGVKLEPVPGSESLLACPATGEMYEIDAQGGLRGR